MPIPNLRQGLFAGLLTTLCLIASTAEASWTRLTETFVDRELHVLALDPHDKDTFYIGARGSLYRSSDRGQKWKAVLKLEQRESRVHCILPSSRYAGFVMAGTDEGIYFTQDHAKHWTRIFHRMEEAEDQVRSLAFNSDSSLILAGTAAGVFISRDLGKLWHRSQGFAKDAIYDIKALPDESASYYVATARGVYKGDPISDAWNQIYHSARSEQETSSGNALSQVEEILLQPPAIALVPQLSQKGLVVIDQRSVHVTADAGVSWKTEVNAMGTAVVAQAQLVGRKHEALVIPTERNVYWYDIRTQRATAMDWGLPHAEIRDVAYDDGEDALYAVTDKGIYTLAQPETAMFFEVRGGYSEAALGNVINRFNIEPSIQELHLVAMRYAEVHPEKIIAWRRRAALKAWVPTLNLGFDYGSDETIELDRGGTNDPDRFIVGPKEADTSWSIDVGWDLSEIIWNADQTSIDNRSKLMVQLRDDILNELNHLFYARRRLQIESLIAPAPAVAQRIDRELKIQEYTAGIDALTGGYLSRRLSAEQGADL